MRVLPVLIMVTAGLTMSFQGPINARLRLATESPVMSAAYSFLSGGLILILLTLAGVAGGTGTGWDGIKQAPWWAFLGGTLGILFVLGSILAIPQVGAVVVICAAIFGQMIGSYLIDSFGWFGVAKTPFEPLRLLGMLLLLTGVILVQRK